MNTITLKAKANAGIDDDFNLITTLELAGDPLNIDSSGAFDLKIEIMVNHNQIQKPRSDEDIEHMVSDAGVAERKHAHAAKHDIKWNHLKCALNKATCAGPDCNTYLGSIYERCPHSSFSTYRK